MARELYCPVDEATRAWLDYRWAWLCRSFGTKGVTSRSIVLPKPEFFPDEYAASPVDVETLVHRVAGYMNVDPAVINIGYYEDEYSLGTYHKNDNGKYAISLEVKHIHDPATVIATTAHELGHVLLLGEERISADEPDGEFLTDLITVFFGMGVMCANNVIRESYWQDGHYASWSIGKQGYLTMNEYGYAFALLARERGEVKPTWLRELRLDVRKACQQSLAYLAVHPPATNLSAVPYPNIKKPPEEPEHSDDPAACTYCGEIVEGANPEEGIPVCEACVASMEEADANCFRTEEEYETACRTANRKELKLWLYVLLAIVLIFFVSFVISNFPLP
jgi:hypothetical protein